MALPLLVIFQFNCGLFSTRRPGPLTEAELCDRQIPYSLAGAAKMALQNAAVIGFITNRP
jgi:hypothetical protein